MPVTCADCGAEFPFASRLARHLARKFPCAAGAHACACGKKFTYAKTLRVHAATCGRGGGQPAPVKPAQVSEAGAGAAQVSEAASLGGARAAVSGETQIRANNLQINTTTTTNTTVGDNSANTIIMMGWPPGWPMPDQRPNPFSPETMQLDPDLVKRTVRRLAAVGADGGEDEVLVEVAASLVMDMLRTHHSHQAERNVYPNPSRGDQALAFAESGQWDTIPHSEARHRLVGTMWNGLKKTGRIPSAPQPDEISRAAAPEFAAHLANLACQAAAGIVAPLERRDCRLPREPPRTWYFGEEDLDGPVPDSHVTSVALHLEECDRRAWGLTDPEAAGAAHAVYMYDRMMLRKTAENYTAFEHEGVAHAWSCKDTKGEWRRCAVGEVARAAFLRSAQEFSWRVRQGAKRPEDATFYDALQKVADYLTLPEHGGVDGVPTPAAEKLASSEVAIALFRRRSDRAREFYLGAVQQGRAGPCETDCGCSRGAARRILRGEP